jgi:hypothetical protein
MKLTKKESERMTKSELKEKEITFELDTSDWDSWTQDFIINDIENQIVEELKKHGLSVDKTKYEWSIVVKVTIGV